MGRMMGRGERLKLVAYIQRYQSVRGLSPTVREMAKEMFRAHTWVLKELAILEAQGLIEVERGSDGRALPRGIRYIDQSDEGSGQGF